MRKVLLLLCIAFVVVCYGYPCLIVPFGTYKYETTNMGEKYVQTCEFKFNGKAKIKFEDLETEYYYKLKGNKIILSNDKKFDDNDMEIKISSMYKIGEAENLIGKIVAIAVGVLAVVLVVTAPSKKS